MSITDKLLAIAENEQKVYDAGKQAEYDRFWDALQENGNRTNYSFAFAGEAWDAETFKPKYPLKPTDAQNMFAYWGQYYPTEKPLVDLREYDIDFSGSRYSYNIFMYNCLVCAVGVVGSSQSKYCQGLFNGAKNLHTIEKLITPTDGTAVFSNTFNECNSLQHITIEGAIGYNIDLHWSPLTADSIRSVVNALSTTVTGLTATFKQTAKEAAFTDDEWAELIATKSNWTFSLV